MNCGNRLRIVTGSIKLRHTHAAQPQCGDKRTVFSKMPLLHEFLLGFFAILDENRLFGGTTCFVIAGSLDPYPLALPSAVSLSLRNKPSRRSAASSAPNASATSAETGTGVPSSIAPAVP